MDDAMSNGDNPPTFVALLEPIEEIVGSRTVIEMFKLLPRAARLFDMEGSWQRVADSLELSSQLSLVRFGCIERSELQR